MLTPLRFDILVHDLAESRPREAILFWLYADWGKTHQTFSLRNISPLPAPATTEKLSLPHGIRQNRCADVPRRYYRMIRRRVAETEFEQQREAGDNRREWRAGTAGYQSSFLPAHAPVQSPAGCRGLPGERAIGH